MTLRSYALAESQYRKLAEFCLTWNCNSLSLLIRYSDQLPVGARDLLDALPHDDIAPSFGPKWTYTLEHIDAVAQLIQICMAKHQGSRPRLCINSGRRSGSMNFRLSVTESLIEICFANTYHA